MFRKFILICALLMVATPVCAQGHIEAWYRDKWCAEQKGVKKVYLQGVRCDCETATHMVEMEFAYNWEEGLGQALMYSAFRGSSAKRPGLVIIYESPTWINYYNRMKYTFRYFGLDYLVDIWVIDQNGNPIVP